MILTGRLREGFCSPSTSFVDFVLLAEEQGVEYAVKYAEEDNRSPKDIRHEPR